MGNQDNECSEGTMLRGALGHPKRLEILLFLLAQKSGDEIELTKALEDTLPRIKYHLEVLRSADMVAHVAESTQRRADRYVAAHP
jgi:DNA-binding transcriptional ArsR family regulator